MKVFLNQGKIMKHCLSSRYNWCQDIQQHCSFTNVHCSWDYYSLLLEEPSHGYFAHVCQRLYHWPRWTKWMLYHIVKFVQNKRKHNKNIFLPNKLHYCIWKNEHQLKNFFKMWRKWPPFWKLYMTLWMKKL